MPERYEEDQILALLRLREEEEIEEQHRASEQRQHDGGHQHEVIGRSVELAHRRPASLVAAAGALATAKYPGCTRSTICATGFSRISK